MIKNIQIVTKIEKIIYCKKDSNWYIIKTSRGTAKGVINFEVKEGDMLSLEGFFQTSKFNGMNEFVFKTALLSVPEDPRTLLHYAVELTKGLGESAEEKIWSHYGENWRTADLEAISGISDDTRFNWIQTLSRLDEQKEKTQAIAFLLSKGATLNMAAVAWERWTKSTVSKVTANCFILADLPHYGFQDVDKIRITFNIGDLDPRRIEAAILYSMNQVGQQYGPLVNHALLYTDLLSMIPDITDELFQGAINK